jgi:hypothetical protein
MVVEIIETVYGATPEQFRERLLEQVSMDLRKIADEHGLGEMASIDTELLRENLFEFMLTDENGTKCRCTIELRPITIH